MKNAKWFSLFFVCMLAVFLGGVRLGYQWGNRTVPYENCNGQKEQPQKEEVAADVSSKEEAVNADTVYVLIERDMETGEEVVTRTKLPSKYLGMTRKQFVESMEDYEKSPPLSELERGFVSLEVNRFSVPQVEVVMNYSYVDPGNCFYIVLYDGKVTVLLEDKKTVYLNTEIALFDLPGQIQQEIQRGMYIPDEESLYDFLEGYTS